MPLASIEVSMVCWAPDSTKHSENNSRWVLLEPTSLSKKSQSLFFWKENSSSKSWWVMLFCEVLFLQFFSTTWVVETNSTEKEKPESAMLFPVNEALSQRGQNSSQSLSLKPTLEKIWWLFSAFCKEGQLFWKTIQFKNCWIWVK